MDLSLEDGTETRKDGTLVCFNPCFHGSLSGRCLLTVAPNLFYDVSILVFMDLSLEDQPHPHRNPAALCFNPCFHGSLSGSLR